MNEKSTEETQNIISRLSIQMSLSLGGRSPAVKRQYAKVQKIFIDLRTELDALNDMKETFPNE